MGFVLFRQLMAVVILFNILIPAQGARRGDNCFPAADKLFKDFVADHKARVSEAALLKQNPEKFKERHKSIDFVTPTHNKKFRESTLAEEVDPPEFYFDGENIVIKELNDFGIKDKDRVTAYANYHKKIFYKNLNSGSYPEIKKHLAQKYSDFKSLRLAMSKKNSKVKKELDELCQQSGHEFAEFLVASGELDGRALRGHAGKPKSWFMCGAGDSMELAGAAVRSARYGENSGALFLRSFDDVEKDLNKIARSAENSRRTLVRQLAKTHPKLFQSIPGDPSVKILSPEVIEVLAKTKVDSRSKEEFLTKVNERLQIKLDQPPLSMDELKLLKEYRDSVDRFSPGIMVDERVVIRLEEAKGEIVSIDFAGQNVKNMEQTMAAVAQSSYGDARGALKAARAGEHRATNELQRRMGEVKRIFKNVFGEDGKPRFSGDDGIGMPSQITQIQKEELVKELSEVDPKGFRMTFVPRGVENRFRSELIVEAESIEKEVRLRLEAVVSQEQLNNVMIAIDMKGVKPGQGDVEAILAGSDIPEISSAVKKVLAEVIQEKGYAKATVNVP